MKILPWIIAAGAGFALVHILTNQPALQTAPASDNLEDAADAATSWGAKQRLSGTGSTIKGKVKEALGEVSGNAGLADEGTLDEADGTINKAASHVAQAVGDTLHDLNN